MPVFWLSIPLPHLLGVSFFLPCFCFSFVLASWWLYIACHIIVRFIICQYHNYNPLLDAGNEKPQFHVSTMDEGLQDAGFSSKFSLPTFGLASYKFKVSDWNADGVNECQKFDSLLRGADNWLRLLKVNHPDYSFFVSHNSYWIWDYNLRKARQLWY